jgi:hypothetical protein
VPWEPKTELTHQEFAAAIAATTLLTSVATPHTTVAGLTSTGNGPPPAGITSGPSASSSSWRSDAMLAAVATPRHVRGVRVTNDHAWMYFIDASKVHSLKTDLRDKAIAASNGTSTTQTQPPIKKITSTDARQ